MKKYLLSVCSLCLCAAASAQGEYDALKYSQTDITGSARYSGMAGAFGSLGGDMSSVGLNPAGIAVYRSSEFAFTPVLSYSTTKADFFGLNRDNSKMNLELNSIGYVGSFRTTSSSVSNFNFGIAYNKIKDFNRDVTITGVNRPTSLMDRVSSDIGKTEPGDLTNLGYLSNSAGLIKRQSDGSYIPLKAGELVRNNFNLQESGSVGEYTFTLGANWAHFLYIGTSLGVQNVNYDMISSYHEYAGTTTNAFDFELRNAVSTTGGGVNVKLGAILRPTASLRFGFALHSPTYYYLTDAFGSSMIPNGVYMNGVAVKGASIGEQSLSYELITPGKLLYSMAYFFGKKGLVSLDCDVIDYREMTLKNEDGIPYDDTNTDISNHMRLTTNIRLGGEYRLTENVSLRAGTAWYQSAYKENSTKNNTTIYTAGTTPYYSFDTGTRYLSAGIGYRTGSFFLDAAVLQQSIGENFFDFLDLSTISSDKYASLTSNRLNAIVSMGFRF
ncbi:MAG: hypothetical protein Q8914_09260 [Bacteroidota bacterium]|nr:hypothetical protein [Bacteroidota bacterium]